MVSLCWRQKFFATDYNISFDKLHNILISAAAAKSLGFSSNEEALGKDIMIWNKKWKVIGVIKDFHQKSLHYAMEPVVLMPLYGSNHPISVKLSTADLAPPSAIKSKYNSFFPGNLFDYYFIDSHFNELYKNDQLFGEVFALFAGFAIL